MLLYQARIDYARCRKGRSGVPLDSKLAFILSTTIFLCLRGTVAVMADKTAFTCISRRRDACWPIFRLAGVLVWRTRGRVSREGTRLLWYISSRDPGDTSANTRRSRTHRNGSHGAAPPPHGKECMCKINRLLLPFMWCYYGIQQTDKISLGTQATFGLRDDPHLGGNSTFG